MILFDNKEKIDWKRVKEKNKNKLKLNHQQNKH
jgi:hypothetical protein